MATITTPYSPMHIDCTIGQPYGNPSTGYSCGFHTGVDFPASGTGQSNPDLYACMPGEIVYLYTNETHEGSGYSQALGNQVQILGDNGIYYRYCHMKYGTNTHLTVGQRVDQNTYIGQMGNTGNSTGTHLHLEASTSQSWNCNNFIVPGEVYFLEIQEVLLYNMEEHLHHLHPLHILKEKIKVGGFTQKNIILK